MELTTVLGFALIVMAALFFIMLFEAVRMKDQSKELKKQNTVQSDKLRIYREFMNNTSVKKFFRILDASSIEAFDVDTKFVLVKYFHKVFINLEVAHVANLITDIKVAKQSRLLTEAFIKALDKEEYLLGNALFYAIKESDNAKINVLDCFLTEVGSDFKKQQINFAIKAVENYLSIDLDGHFFSDYYREIKSNLIGLQTILEN